MKTQIFKTGLLFTILILIMSCEKKEKPVNELLLGSWYWIKTITPYGSQETNPLTEGYRKVYVFRDDGKMIEYINITLNDSSYYSVEINPSNSNTFRITSTIINSHFYFEADTVIFSEAYVDGPVTYFAKGLPNTLPL